MTTSENDESAIRITNITISEQNTPELFCELNGISQKARGERLRCLATIGLLCVTSPKASLNLGIASDENINKNINVDKMQNEGITNTVENAENTRELEVTKKIMSNFN